MKHLALIIILASVFSCTSENSADNSAKSFNLEIQDSIQVDYLGNLNVFDFDPESGLYLGLDSDVNDVVLFDEDGKSQPQFSVQTAKSNVITWVVGKGFLDGKATLMDVRNGLFQFDTDGEVNRIEIPREHYYFNELSFSAYKLGTNYSYIRPERDEAENKDQSAFYKRIYESPLLEVLDSKTGDVSNTMEFPPGSIYEDGNYYGWMFPTIAKRDGKWYLHMRAERKYHVYEEKEDEVIYVKTVDLEIPDALDVVGVPIETPWLLNRQLAPNLFGRIESLYPLSDYTILIYTKGEKNETLNQYDTEKAEELRNFIDGIPRFAAVFDRNDSLLQKDIELPKGLVFNGVYNSEDEIIALKNQNFFGAEDKTSIYKLKISN
ncbi:hypothetical protein LV84_03060 [Algoriphagus ratkowskyi]|uniref:DUF4221 domain-containing protein n=1 Tax=Algoriphagus ratkowskyi TaxID=57028 RepID=A0A2W7STC6_9BACT|nr:hypothetical protein [Algoriphagus ratkowskyi]PZX53952.1 hypothetical protein LV84_03060 [Algoriphagus ratkowskyi]TXD76648.1 hypothetical protein ESW18_14895 [Algoriphagus ratkowskyi]